MNRLRRKNHRWLDRRRHPMQSGSSEKVRLVNLVSSLNREVRAMSLGQPAHYAAEPLEMEHQEHETGTLGTARPQARRSLTLVWPRRPRQ